MAAYVAIDDQGYYYDPESGTQLDLYYDDQGNPYNVEDGMRLQWWSDSGVDPNVITMAIKDTLLGIFGNPAAVAANARGTRYPGPLTTQSGIPVYSQSRTSASSGSGIQLSTSTLMLIGGAVLLFMLGQSRGGRR